MKKRLILLASLFCFVSALTFASGSSETNTANDQALNQKVTMKVSTWTSNKDQIALLSSFVDEFAQKKGIDIDCEFETITFGEYTTKLSMELQGNDAPDVFWMLETTAPTFVSSSLLADLSSALQEYDFADLSPAAMSLWEKDGKVFGVPFSTSPFFIIYNEDLFKEAGLKTPEQMKADGQWTWENFRKVSKELTDATGVYAYQTPDGGGYDSRILHNLVPIIRSYGSDAWTDDNQILINSDESVEAVTLFHNMVYKDGSVVPPGNQSDFFAGDAAMTMAQVSRISKLEGASFNWGMVTIPEGPAGEVPVIGQAAICANAKSKNGSLAAELVAYMTSKSCVERMAGIWPPARKSVLTSNAFLNSNSAVTPEQMKDTVATSINNGKVLPSHRLYPQIEVESKMVWDKLWNANADVASVLDEVATVYKKYIK